MSGSAPGDTREALLEATLDEERRRRHGQHFTKPDPADLLVALCVRDAGATVLDPACGTGILLRRAALRLRYLAGGDGRAAGGRLTGVEKDTMLAAEARRSVPEARIVAADFLEEAAWRGPAAGGAGTFDVVAGFDVVVGNPPYVRQELIDPSIKTRAAQGGPALSGRSDLHARFWHPALEMLRPGGRLGFITSATWLDAGYGAALRDWLGAHHRLVALVESQAETWFDHARVRTAIAIVQREPPDDSRPVRFASLRVPLAALVPPGLPERQRLERFERIASAIERGETDERIAVRSVPPASLARRTWGPPLRLPDLYFDIVARGAERMVPLSEVATVRWGIKTGDDAVFCPVRAQEPPVEERFLAPLVFRLADVDRLAVTPDGLRRWVLLVDRRAEPRGRDPLGAAPRLAAWIARAERERGSHHRPTCAARQRAGRAWYELRPGPPGAILWSIMHQYRHLAPMNPHGLLANDNLLQIDPQEGVEARLLGAILNAHVVALVKCAHGRQRNEGMLKTQAADVRAMRILDPRILSPRQAGAIVAAFDAIGSRRIETVSAECARSDRRALDRLVLEALGWRRGESGAAAERLWACLTELHAGERRWEIDAMARRRLGQSTDVPGARE